MLSISSPGVVRPSSAGRLNDGRSPARRLLAVLFAALLMVGFAQGQAQAQEAVSEAGYRLASGDKLRISTFGEPALSGDFVLGEGGVLPFPLIGDVKAEQLTPAQLRSKLETALKDGYLLEPRVSIEVLTRRPYYVLGEVNRPGEYTYTSGLTVMNAVAAASGFTYRANSRRVFIKRAGQAAEELVPLTAGVQVQPGDTIRIGERYF